MNLKKNIGGSIYCAFDPKCDFFLVTVEQSGPIETKVTQSIFFSREEIATFYEFAQATSRDPGILASEEPIRKNITAQPIPAPPSLSEWIAEEDAKTIGTIRHLRDVLGSIEADLSPAYNFLRGYLAGIRAVERKNDE
jgi:hypothetical protein